MPGFSLEGLTPSFERKSQLILKVQSPKPDIWECHFLSWNGWDLFARKAHPVNVNAWNTVVKASQACDQSPREPVRLVLSQCRISAFSLRQPSGGINAINQQGHQASSCGLQQNPFFHGKISSSWWISGSLLYEDSTAFGSLSKIYFNYFHSQS